ncbi:hypothetical protein DUNSADRAFT_14576 [Dunaliella salina]|uniref:Encoded protein n=1 Tax=Dunaliella salina TaxID=3046 RepID=A0ABQ7G744_DUNSA|nr:hypothetical protein DUNSADRAFT_14576 [Dunaliella salina]|eukprot:KAF5830438.1 hypothetical protein DUNSADRAFT_14576 [Dunaliella salina]
MSKLQRRSRGKRRQNDRDSTCDDLQGYLMRLSRSSLEDRASCNISSWLPATPMDSSFQHIMGTDASFMGKTANWHEMLHSEKTGQHGSSDNPHAS